jgi:hypothetical protein
VANMCNAVVLGAVWWRSPVVVTVNTPAPASCMKSLSATRAVVKTLDAFCLSLSQKSRNEKCYLSEVTVNGTR